MTTRLILDKFKEVLSVTDNLKKNGYLTKSSPFDLWLYTGKNPLEAIPYFYLSLMAGDITSARSIILNIKHNNRFDYELDKNLLCALTNTLWQSANEYLCELDFGRAGIYNNIYLECSKHILADGLSFSNNFARRNRTLSHILQSEIKSQRIKSLCNYKSIISFGFLLGLDSLGYEIRELPGLNERRNLFSQFHCKDMQNVPSINYSILSELKSQSNDACKAFPSECEYNNFFESIFKFVDKQTRWEPFNQYYFEKCMNDRLFTTNYSKEIVRALFFVSNCSYLSDDLLFILLEQLNFLDKNIRIHNDNKNFLMKNILPIDILDKAIYCVEASSGDNKAYAIGNVNELNCELINWEPLVRNNFKIYSSSMKDVSAKCGKHLSNLQ